VRNLQLRFPRFSRLVGFLSGSSLLIAFGGGCGGDDSTAPADGSAEASSEDATTDAPAALDATGGLDGSGDVTLPPPQDSGGGVDGAAMDGSDGGAPFDAPGDAPPDATPDVTPDAATDATASDGAAAFACTTWKYASPIVLDDFSLDASGVSFGGELWVDETAAGQVRVVTGPSSGPTFRVYGYDKDAGTPSSLDGPTLAGGIYETAHHFAGASPLTQVLVQQEAYDGSDNLSLTAYLLPDPLSLTGSVPSPIQVSPGGFGVVALPFANGDVFAATATTYTEAPPEVDYALSVGLATPSTEATLAQVQLSPHVDDFQDLAMAHVGSSVYLFASNGAATLGESVWVVPDTGVLSGTVTPRAFDSADDSHVVDLAPAAAGGATNFAYYAVGSDGGVAVSVGQVADGTMPTVTAGNLTIVRTYPGIGGTPVDGTRAEWYGDHLMAIAPVASGAGANLLWVDALGNVWAEQVGANAVLTGESSITTIVASPAGLSATGGAWDVAWVEQRPGGDVLLYNELDCQ
jgi:hypothetical protein